MVAGPLGSFNLPHWRRSNQSAWLCSGQRPDCGSYHNAQKNLRRPFRADCGLYDDHAKPIVYERAARRALARREDHENRRFRASPAVAAFVPNDALEDEPAELCWAGLLII